MKLFKKKKNPPCDLHTQFQKPILRGAPEQAYPGHSPGNNLNLCSGLAIVQSMKMYHVHCDLEYIVKNFLNSKCLEFLMEK